MDVSLLYTNGGTGSINVASNCFYTVPAEANVFYACRGIWSILLAVWLGKKLGLNETKTESIVFIRRLIGAILLVIGIYFTF